ncbi:MAG TPA: hypothetical protein VLG69_00730 [Candidatus Andersenbacteria bacterium]|nr:hypothetical protein [Candidatus Andersenbacteria bacterium]
MTVIAGIPLVLLIIYAIPVSQSPLPTPRPRFSLTCFYALCVLILLSVGYIEHRLVEGGDTDPIKFLEGKTKYKGGYQYLVKKTTYREHVVSDRPFLNHPFSEYELLHHIPSIAKIEKHPFSFALNFGMHSPNVTMTLSNAVIHVKYDEHRLMRSFFEPQSHLDDSPEFLAANYLKHLADPIFKRMQEYPPDTGSFGFDIREQDYSLGDLEEKYGIHIVALPEQTPRLSFAITYSQPPNPDAPLFEQHQIKKMLNASEREN